MQLKSQDASFWHQKKEGTGIDETKKDIKFHNLSSPAQKKTIFQNFPCGGSRYCVAVKGKACVLWLQKKSIPRLLCTAVLNPQPIVHSIPCITVVHFLAVSLRFAHFFGSISDVRHFLKFSSFGRLSHYLLQHLAVFVTVVHILVVSLRFAHFFGLISDVRHFLKFSSFRSIFTLFATAPCSVCDCCAFPYCFVAICSLFWLFLYVQLFLGKSIFI